MLYVRNALVVVWVVALVTGYHTYNLAVGIVCVILALVTLGVHVAVLTSTQNDVTHQKEQ